MSWETEEVERKERPDARPTCQATRGSNKTRQGKRDWQTGQPLVGGELLSSLAGERLRALIKGVCLARHTMAAL